MFGESVMFSVNRCGFLRQRGRDHRILPDFLSTGRSKKQVASFASCVLVKLSLSQSSFSALVSRLFWCSSVAVSLDVGLQVQKANQICSGNHRLPPQILAGGRRNAVVSWSEIRGNYVPLPEGEVGEGIHLKRTKRSQRWD